LAFPKSAVAGRGKLNFALLGEEGKIFPFLLYYVCVYTTKLGDGIFLDLLPVL